MSKHKYREIPGTMQNLFTRQLATDEADASTAAWADHILKLLDGKLSEGDMEQLRTLLAGGEVDDDAPIKGSAVAQDSAAEAAFYRQFPSAKRIGRDPYPGGFR